MRVIVAGSTTWTNAERIREALLALGDSPVHVIHGDAPGADALGGEVAAQLGYSVQPMAKNDEDYRRFGRGAWKGLNERMLAVGADVVLAFHPAMLKSRGTKHLVQLANEAGVEVRLFGDRPPDR